MKQNRNRIKSNYTKTKQMKMKRTNGKSFVHAGSVSPIISSTAVSFSGSFSASQSSHHFLSREVIYQICLSLDTSSVSVIILKIRHCNNHSATHSCVWWSSMQLEGPIFFLHKRYRSIFIKPFQPKLSHFRVNFLFRCTSFQYYNLSANLIL